MAGSHSIKGSLGAMKDAVGGQAGLMMAAIVVFFAMATYAVVTFRANISCGPVQCTERCRCRFWVPYCSKNSRSSGLF